jgi:hypothetical protein
MPNTGVERRVLRDDDLQAELEREGFVVVDALSRNEASAIREHACRAIDEAVPVNDPQGALYGTLFDGPRRGGGAAIADGILAPLLDALLAGFRYEGGYVVAKPPQSGRLDMHQHQPVTHDIYEPAVHCWLTLDHSSAGRGGLRVVPGSHAITRHVQSFDSAPYFASFADVLETRHARTLELEPGQAVIFERSLLHGSEPNNSFGPLLRILGTAIPAESNLCVLAEAEPGRFEALEVGDGEIDPDLYCIARDNRAALKYAGLVANRNMQLTEEEFAALVAAGKKIAPGFDPIDRIRSGRT